LDIPLEAKDWWTFVLPGGFVLFELLMAYDVLTYSFSLIHIPTERFAISSVLSLNAEQATVASLVFVLLSLATGLGIELVSYKAFSEEAKVIMSNSVNELLSDKSVFKKPIEELLLRVRGFLGEKDPKPETLNLEIVWTLVYFLWSQGSDSLVKDIDKTITAWGFYRSMSIASFFGFAGVIWLFLNGFPVLSVVSLVLIAFAIRFFNDQRKSVRQSYFHKILMYSLVNFKVGNA
jgi:hypothetical protein